MNKYLNYVKRNLDNELVFEKILSILSELWYIFSLGFIGFSVIETMYMCFYQTGINKNEIFNSLIFSIIFFLLVIFLRCKRYGFKGLFYIVILSFVQLLLVMAWLIFIECDWALAKSVLMLTNLFFFYLMYKKNFLNKMRKKIRKTIKKLEKKVDEISNEINTMKGSKDYNVKASRLIKKLEREYKISTANKIIAEKFILELILEKDEELKKVKNIEDELIKYTENISKGKFEEIEEWYKIIELNNYLLKLIEISLELIEISQETAHIVKEQ